MITPFFDVKPLEAVLSLTDQFSPMESETIAVENAFSRVLSCDIAASADMPGFRRATMDGYAVAAASTFGASESSPAWLNITGIVPMGGVPDFKLAPGTAARISTGGMLPKGADSVVMIEHTDLVDEESVEIYKSVAPLQHVIDASEDFAKGEIVLSRGRFIRPQEQGLLAGMGIDRVDVFRRPRVGIISTGDEIIPISETAGPGRIRDINSYALAGFVEEAHAVPVCYGIVADDRSAVEQAIQRALAETDMVLVSGGSSVGAKDYTLDVLSQLTDARILVHGIAVSPGKPTILAGVQNKMVWGLPGQVVSAMVVFKVVVVPFLDRIKGLDGTVPAVTIYGQLTRNIASAQGRRDFVRVILEKTPGGYRVKPVLGKSGLIKTMIYADGLLEIGEDVEGLEKGSTVEVILL